jgi:hypothetical protein
MMENYIEKLILDVALLFMQKCGLADYLLNLKILDKDYVKYMDKLYSIFSSLSYKEGHFTQIPIKWAGNRLVCCP